MVEPSNIRPRRRVATKVMVDCSARGAEPAVSADWPPALPFALRASRPIGVELTVKSPDLVRKVVQHVAAQYLSRCHRFHFRRVRTAP